MPRWKLFAVGLCVLLNMVDGYDILIVAFGAPAIKVAWHLSADDLGLLFSAGLAGMGIGGVALASLADTIGRRRVVLMCLVLTTTGMLLGAAAQTLAQLAMCRFVTGVAVGGIMPAINTIVAEYTDGRHRGFAIVIQAAGYPLGGALGGVLAIQLLPVYGWRSLLICGGALSVLLFVIAITWIPESVEYLVNRRPANALAHINRIRSQSGMPQLSTLPPLAAEKQRVGFGALMSADLARVTLLMCAVTFLVQSTFYFVVNWAPMLFARGAVSPALGVSGTMLLNAGGIIGDLLFAVLCLRASPRKLGALAMIGCFVGIAVSTTLPRGAAFTLPSAAMIGGLLFASMASIYVIAPAVFPPLARSTGTGLALSVGRVGATIGPFVGAILLGHSPEASISVLATLAAPLLVAALILLMLLRA
jgi:benzoate transport